MVKSIPLISLIIVNHNGRHLIKFCLESMYHQSFKNMEIIVVDNASHDGSVEFVKDFFPEVKVVSLPDNMGFAGANREGLKNTRGDYVLLLNNDVEADTECVKDLVAVLEADPALGIGAVKLIVSGTNVIDSAGDGYATFLKGFKRGEGKSAEEYNLQEYIFGACAGAALYRRTMLEEIGFFDEDFFLIHEDTDLNFRAHLAGWKVLYVPTAIVYHKVRSSIGHMSDMAVYYTLRNSELVRVKNIPLGVFFRCLPSFIVGIVTEFFYFAIKHGKFKLYFKAKKDAMKLLPKMLKKRKVIMKHRKTDNKYLMGMLTPVWQKGFLRPKIQKFLYD